MRSARICLIAFPVVLAGALTACGGSGGGGDETVTVTNGAVTLEAGEYFFSADRIETAPGDLEVTLIQDGNEAHTFVIDDVDDFKLEVNGDPNDNGTVTLEAGTYTYYCDIPGHQNQGMEGTLVVE